MISFHKMVVVLDNLKVLSIVSQLGQIIGMWLNFHTFHELKALWLVAVHYAVCTFHLSVLQAMDSICYGPPATFVSLVWSSQPSFQLFVSPSLSCLLI